MSRTVLSFVSLTLMVALAGCGSEVDPPITPPPPKAVIKVLIDPNPVTAESTGNKNYPWNFRVNVQLSDSGGVGFIVTSMETTVASAMSGAPLARTSQNPFVGVKIPANGQETRQFYMGPYRMELGTREAKVSIKMNFVDDAGNAAVYDGSVDVLTVGEPIRVDE